MTVEVHFGVFVSKGDRVVEMNVHSLRMHDVVGEGLLKFRGHEIVARTGSAQDRKMDLEPEQIEHERYNYEPNRTVDEMLRECHQIQGALSAVDV